MHPNSWSWELRCTPVKKFMVGGEQDCLMLHVMFLPPQDSCGLVADSFRFWQLSHQRDTEMKVFCLIMNTSSSATKNYLVLHNVLRAVPCRRRGVSNKAELKDAMVSLLPHCRTQWYKEHSISLMFVAVSACGLFTILRSGR